MTTTTEKASDIPTGLKLANPLPVNRSWSLRDLRLPREEMREAVQSAASVPDSAKADMISMIDALEPGARLVALDAHAFFVNGRFDKHVSIRPL